MKLWYQQHIWHTFFNAGLLTGVGGVDVVQLSLVSRELPQCVLDSIILSLLEHQHRFWSKTDPTGWLEQVTCSIVQTAGSAAPPPDGRNMWHSGATAATLATSSLINHAAKHNGRANVAGCALHQLYSICVCVFCYLHGCICECECNGTASHVGSVWVIQTAVYSVNVICSDTHAHTLCSRRADHFHHEGACPAEHVTGSYGWKCITGNINITF